MHEPRKLQVLQEELSYCHCVSRFARHTPLCCVDAFADKSIKCQRLWIVDRLKMLADIIVIDVSFYVVLSNHYHDVLHVDTVCG